MAAGKDGLNRQKEKQETATMEQQNTKLNQQKRHNNMQTSTA